jgi:putative ABC transport system permease protein
VRAYRALLRLLPTSVREPDDDEMARTFAAMWSAASGTRRRVRLSLTAFTRLPVVVLAEWSDLLRRALPPDTLVRVTRQSLRGLLRAPAFSASAALLIGLGVGSVTTIFTVVDQVLLRPLPYPDSDRLVLVRGSQSQPAVRDFESLDAIEAWAAASVENVDMTGAGEPIRLREARITDGFLPFFGARLALGSELPDGASPDAVVLSDEAWSRIWARDPGVVGRTVRIDGSPVLVVGVAHPFAQPEVLLEGLPVDLWRPFDRSSPEHEDRFERTLVVAGRLTPGATLDDARSQAADLARRRARDFPDNYVRRDGTIVELPLNGLVDATTGPARTSLGLLLGAVSLLLLVACVNVAHLFLARGLGRSREASLRRALGAGSASLAGQVTSECLLIGLAGAAIGVVLAWSGVRGFLLLAPGALPRAATISFDGRALAFATGLSSVTALAFGLLPTLRLWNRDPGIALRQGGRSATGGPATRAVRSGLVAAEIALSLVLVSCAGLLLRSYDRLQREELGFRTEDVWTIPFSRLAPDGEVGPWIERMDRMADAVRAAAGVRAVGYGLSAPLEHIGGTCCWGGDVRSASGMELREIPIHAVAGDYFDVFEPRVLTGAPRLADLPRTAVLNESLAVRLFGSAAGAIGDEILIRGTSHRVSGVIAEDRHYGPRREHGPAAYVPIASVPFVPDRAAIVVRVQSGAGDVRRSLRDAVWAVEPDLSIPIVRSMQEWETRATADTRFDSLFFATFGLTALVLAAAGVYGTLLYVIGAERRELGIRAALGATQGRIALGVLRRGLTTAGIGVTLGAAGSWGAGRLLESRLFGVSVDDPLALGGAAAVLLLTAAAACWLPARRAAAIDPMETLRS